MKWIKPDLFMIKVMAIMSLFVICVAAIEGKFAEAMVVVVTATLIAIYYAQRIIRAKHYYGAAAHKELMQMLGRFKKIKQDQ